MFKRGADVDEVVSFSPQHKDLDNSFPAKQLALELEEVDTGRISWTEVCFIQFLATGNDHVRKVLDAAPGVPLMAGAGVHHRSLRRTGYPQADDDVTPPVARGNTLDVQVWLPRASESVKARFGQLNVLRGVTFTL